MLAILAKWGITHAKHQDQEYHAHDKHMEILVHPYSLADSAAQIEYRQALLMYELLHVLLAERLESKCELLVAYQYRKTLHRQLDHS